MQFGRNLVPDMSDNGRHFLGNLALDQYREDHGANPDSLQALVEKRYLRD